MEVVRHSSFQVLPKLAAACCYLSTMGEWSRTRVQLYTKATLEVNVVGRRSWLRISKAREARETLFWKAMFRMLESLCPELLDTSLRSYARSWVD